MNKSTCKPFKRWISVPYVPLGPLNDFPFIFLPGVLGPFLSGAGPKGWGASCEAQIPCSFEKNAELRRSLPLCVTMLRVGFGRTVKYGLSYLPWCGPFIFCHGAAVHLVYRSFSEETDAYVTTPEGGGSNIFLCCHLEPNNYCFNLQPQLLWQP